MLPTYLVFGPAKHDASGGLALLLQVIRALQTLALVEAWGWSIRSLEGRAVRRPLSVRFDTPSGVEAVVPIVVPATTKESVAR